MESGGTPTECGRCFDRFCFFCKDPIVVDFAVFSIATTKFLFKLMRDRDAKSVESELNAVEFMVPEDGESAV